MTSKILSFFLVLLIVLPSMVWCEPQILSDKVDEAVFGDIGDEVHTNLPTQIRKSVIPIVNKSEKGKQMFYSVEEKRTTRILKPFDHFINPLFSRDFISLKTSKIKPLPKMFKKSEVEGRTVNKQLSSDEIFAIHKLHKIIAPSTVHEILTKKSNIASHEVSKLKAIRFVKYLRNFHTATDIGAHHKFSPSHHFYYKRTWAPLPKNVKLQSPFDDKIANSKNLYFKHKSNTYEKNSRLKDLSKVTMKWTGYKAIDELRKASPHWLSVLKSAIQPKKIAISKERQNRNSRKLYDIQQLYNVRETSKLDGNHILKVNTMMFPDKRKIQSKTSKKQAKLTKSIKKEKEKPYEEEKQKVINIMAYRPYQPINGQHDYLNYQHPFYMTAPQQIAAYPQHAMSTLQPQQAIYTPPAQIMTFPQAQQPIQNTQQEASLPATQQVISSQYLSFPQTTAASSKNYLDMTKLFFQTMSYVPDPGVVPYNYNHAERMLDGRIRPALYPIANHIPLGKCLPENSLCDKGMHEQCCGANTFCVDYWGINKCLAYSKQSFADLHDPFQIRNNDNYKNYYTYLETQI